VLAIGVLAALAAIFPWELGEKADAFAPAPAGIRPEWYFLFMFQTLKLIPAKVLSFDGEVLGILAFGVGGLLWFILPFLDNPTKPRRRLLFKTVGVIVVVYIVALTIVGFVS
jgi:cytochrome b6